MYESNSMDQWTVCLEPDPKSREAQEELRDLLLQKLFKAYDKFSPTSSIARTGSLPKSVLLGDSAYLSIGTYSGILFGDKCCEVCKEDKRVVEASYVSQ
jgi:hypothetical protein